MKAIVLSICAMLPLFAASTNDEMKRIHEATNVLDEIMNAGDKSIPHDLLEKAQCVGIVPNLKRAGFVIGGQYGKGIVTCRVHGGEGWSAPAAIRIEGGSIGLQIGAGETDLVFLVMNEAGMNRLTKDKFTVGGDASVMAGPVGRTADAQTDVMMRAEILAYSRARGVFGGITLQGATMRADNDDNAKLYGPNVTQEQILHGHVNPTASETPLFKELNRWAPHKG